MQHVVDNLVKTEPILFGAEERLTNLPVEDFFLSVADWFNDFEKRLEESEVTESAGLIIELLPLSFLLE